MSWRSATLFERSRSSGSDTTDHRAKEEELRGILPKMEEGPPGVRETPNLDTPLKGILGYELEQTHAPAI